MVHMTGTVFRRLVLVEPYKVSSRRHSLCFHDQKIKVKILLLFKSSLPVTAEITRWYLFVRRISIQQYFLRA